MAFQSAAGWQNLPNGAFVPTIYSKKVLKFFRKTAVVEDITNTDYYGEIAEFGDTVRILKEPTMTVSSYARGTTVLPQDILDEDFTLTVDKANYFAFKIDDIEQKQTHVNWMDMATSSAAYAIKDAYDVEVLDHMYDQIATDHKFGTSGSSIDLGFGAGEVSPLTVMNRLSRLLDEDNVPTDNRWFVAGPVFWEMMKDENSKLMDTEYMNDGDSIVRNGRVTSGLIRGFKCYSSNNMPTDTNSVAMGGHMSSTATASQISKVEKIRSETSFSDVVRGLHMYGRKVLRPSAMVASVYAVD
jgi:hypothetical protein